MIKLNFVNVEKVFNKNSLRERIVIFCGLLICTFSISYFWILEPMMLNLGKAEKALQSSYQQEKKLNNQIAEIKLRLQKDPLQEINNNIAFSLRTLAALDKQLDEKLVKFIQARKMPLALSKVLRKSPGVKVVSLTTLPVKRFNSPAGISEAASLNNIFYKHTLEIQLIGDYNAIFQYFLNLEMLPEKFYGSALTYQVTDYPQAKVTVQIYTLSDQQDLVSG